MVIDEQDRNLAPRIAALGMQTLVTQTIMGEAGDRRRLAAEILTFGRDLPKLLTDWQTVTTADADEGGAS
jgi:hypothetical protein